MLRAITAAAVLTTAIAARPGHKGKKGTKKHHVMLEDGDDAKFVGYAATINKHYRNKSDFDNRELQWKQNLFYLKKRLERS